MSLLDRRLLVTAGKGGVGRSTVSAALALVAASRGKRVLVCEVNSHERISALLGAPRVHETIRRVARGVDAVVVRPDEAMREYALMQLRFKPLYKAVFENRFASRFLRFIPSLPELVMLGKILFHVKEERWDLVIVDAPATGHGLTFLGVPQALIETIPRGTMRSEAEWMRELLRDPSATAVNLVSLPEELPVNETVELARATRGSLRMSLGGVFLNRYVEARFDQEELSGLASSSGVLGAAANGARAHEVRAGMSMRYRQKLEEIGRPLVALPLLYPGLVEPSGDFSRASVEALADVIRREAA
ncbi:ArsA family ATPase [Vulgatibacter incomptus]|uniref:arsenite-transporting ATPase n=1 Tax=Vulgatibacter incomptus TaxID=1391653 RepID=A0A0K1P9R1_9BACT|nr:ArsA-related P-loop ATPase [Vulgatibacter incomptus]AKU90171.1 Arsenical pump-driving ATPase [Vulgatibacter incomptus]